MARPPLPPLPRRQKLARGHHVAMPYAQVPGFLAKLRERESIASLALEFTILTAARTGEVIGARWDEIEVGATENDKPGPKGPRRNCPAARTIRRSRLPQDALKFMT